jgi:DNA helicase II / ATP-dependent DNA helicase PcrA
MPLITDLHLHSKYSRACSPRLDLPNIHAWAQLKGIDLLSAADFTHPRWFAELREQLEEVDTGVYELKKEFVRLAEDHVPVPEKCVRPVRFLMSTEVSLIYKKGGQVRKVHLLIMAPNIQTAAKINVELDKRGNITADGRPIIGMDSKELLKVLLDISSDIQIIPAHIWTPWFAIFGSKSGFDSIEECFEELSDHICALETGLSSDPLMNWRLSQLDKYALVSNSDAHSPEKMGREATIFDTDYNYPGILNALRHDHSKILGTIEFFPEEGKYHTDGLREEGLRLLPDETISHDFVSPKTGHPITVGVLHRVNDLADRPMGTRPKNGRDYWHIIPLIEILSEIIGYGPKSKKVQAVYFELLTQLGPEFTILKDLSIGEIALVNEVVAEAIDRMRRGAVIIQAGFDGEFGVIKLFKENELKTRAQTILF